MATAYTSLLGLALPVTGELSGTWGDTVNNAITSLLDSAVAGTTTLSTDADVTLTTTTGATNQARQAILLCSGARTAIRNITAPAQSKMYVVINNTTGGYGVVIRGAGPTTGVTVANGKTAVVVWNGSDFVEVAPATATTATNLAGGAAGSLPYQSGAGATTFLSIGTSNFVLTSNGTAPVWTTNTGTGNVVRATSPTIDAPTITTSLSASAPIFTTGTISSNAASRLGLQANEIWSWGANASTQGTVTFRLRSSDGLLGSSPVAITSAGMDVTGALTASTSARSPIVIGGTGTTSTLALRSTSGVGTTGADIIFQTGNNGATEAMRILNSGNVGIGTSSPSQKLQAIGAIESIASNAYRGIRLEAGTGTPQTIKAVNYLGVSYAADLAFNTDSNGVDSEKMRILGNGNVGIGTSAPSVLLDIVANANPAMRIAQTQTTGGECAINFSPGFSGTYGDQSIKAINAELRVSSSTVGGTNAVTTFYTGSSTTERMRIDSSGNVGIGTSSPSMTLDVRGASTTSGASRRLVYISDTTTGFASGVGGGIALAGIISAGGTVATFGGIQAQKESSTEGVQSGYLTLVTNNGSTLVERMRIDSAGNVGIGTTSPVNKLDISGSFGRGAPVTKTTNFTLAATENWVICNGAGTITVTLPAASSWTGREVMIKTIAAQTVVSASSNVVPLTGGAAGTAILAATAGKWATLVSDGTNWVIMSAA